MTTRSVFTALLVCWAAAAQPPQKLAGGPYVVNAGPRSATIAWLVEESWVKLGEAAGQLDRSAPALRLQKVSLGSLKPGATIHYDVLGGEEGKGRFKTPPDGPASFKFVVFGDTRTRHELHQRVVNAIVKVEPDFVLHTGDLVADGYDAALWSTFFSIERELLRRTVFFPVLGNHERNNRQFFEFFEVSTPYYAFDWGTAHFMIIDSAAGGRGVNSAGRANLQDEQNRWLEAELQRSAKADFRFVVLHHPPYTVNQRESHMSKYTPTLVPLFEKYRVTAVFGGHDHNYQRHVKNGVQYIVTGGGGAPLAAADPPLPGLTEKVASVEHFVVADVQKQRAKIDAIALDGRLIESVNLGRN